MRNLSRTALVGVAAVLTVAAAAAPASAGTDATSSVTGSWTRFISYGDKFENCDTSPDGYLSYMDFEYVRKDGSVQHGTHYNPGNNGDCATWNHNFGEGRTVWFRSCVDVIAPFPDTCDRWRTGVA